MISGGVDSASPTRPSPEKRERIRTFSETKSPKHMRRCESNASEMSAMSSTLDDSFSSADERQSSESVRSTKLEDLITCPIHLGMMDDPRILPCGHAFCLNCLHNWFIRLSNSNNNPILSSASSSSSSSSMSLTSNSLTCPLCRRDCKVSRDSIHYLPPALAIKQLTDYIINIQSRHYVQKYYPHMGNRLILDDDSDQIVLDQKREMVKRLLKEISERSTSSDELESIVNEIEQMVLPVSKQNSNNNNGNNGRKSVGSLAGKRNVNDDDRAVISSLNNVEVFSSNYELMDVETIRENMKKYSEYKVQRDSNSRLAISCKMNNSSSNSFVVGSNGNKGGDSKIVSADMWIVNGEIELFVWIYFGETEVRIRDVQLEERRKLRINGISLSNQLVAVRLIDRNEIFVAADCSLVQCNLTTGSVIRKIDMSSSVAGMHLDYSSVILCIPEENKVVELAANDNLQTVRSYHLTGLQPTYVASTEHEIWASCPREGRIAIIDRRSGSFRQLGTNQIYNAVPSQIIVTSDNRVLFLDCYHNRIFWIRKRNDFILIQRITFAGHHYKQLSAKMTAFVAVQSGIGASISSIGVHRNQVSDNSNMGGSVELGRVLICTGDRACIVKPAKCIGRRSSQSTHYKNLACTIL